MIKYIFKRLGLMVLTLWLIISITYIGMLLMPGKPYPNYQKLTEEQLVQLDQENGFDRPISTQYIDYMTDIFLGENFPNEIDPLALDFGKSFQNSQPVDSQIAKRYPVSLSIGLWAVAIGSLIGIGLGLLAAIKKNGVGDYLATFIAVIGVSFPSFVIAAYVQYIFSVKLHIFPAIFTRGDPLGFILPVFALSFFAIASTARMTRTEMVELSNSDFVMLARAKGVSSKNVIIKHSFRNALVSVLTILGPLMVSLTTGSLVIEKIFSIPGIGGMLTEAVLTKDIYVVCGVTFFLSLQILLMYLIVDILYAIVDPRIQLGGSK